MDELPIDLAFFLLMLKDAQIITQNMDANRPTSPHLDAVKTAFDDSQITTAELLSKVERKKEHIARLVSDLEKKRNREDAAAIYNDLDELASPVIKGSLIARRTRCRTELVEALNVDAALEM